MREQNRCMAMLDISAPYPAVTCMSQHLVTSRAVDGPGNGVR